ncbi:MAG: M56 family metallopeptidase [Bacteroidia bacterium]
MISWLITSILLSWTGLAVYQFLVRRRGSAWQRKWFLYSIIAVSLLLPALLRPINDKPILLPEEHEVVAFGQQWHGTDMHLKHYCKCEKPNLSHRIRYRTHHWYNVLLEYKSLILMTILGAMLLVLLRLVFQYRYLFILKKNARLETRTMADGTIIILHPDKKIGVGAFQLLGKPYVIWQPEMDSLSSAEINAIISHEISHLRQFNTLERAMLKLLQCIWLLNPGFYFFQNELDLLSELIADAAGSRTMNSRKAYAQLLLSLKMGQRRQLVSGFKTGGRLATRIRFLLQHPQRHHWAWPLCALLIVFAADLLSAPRLNAQVNTTLRELATYEEICREYPSREEVIYCRDCETVCLPGE